MGPTRSHSQSVGNAKATGVGYAWLFLNIHTWYLEISLYSLIDSQKSSLASSTIRTTSGDAFLTVETTLVNYCFQEVVQQMGLKSSQYPVQSVIPAML